jgi:hypothetical protein
MAGRTAGGSLVLEGTLMAGAGSSNVLRSVGVPIGEWLGGVGTKLP